MKLHSIAVIGDHITRNAHGSQHGSDADLFGLALGLARRVLGRLLGLDPVIALEPAAEIDIGAASRAEGLMPRHGELAADRAAARAGGERRDGILRHGSDIVSSRHDVKSGALAVWFDGNENLPPEPGFEFAQSSGGGTAKRRLDRRADDQPPVRGGACACFALDEPQYLERQRKAALAGALRF